jgi:ribosomal protein S18 acetylase RimI-like enzyme
MVHLGWERQVLPTAPTTRVALRPMTREDIPAVQVVDSLGFAPVWRNSASALTLGWQQAAYATVAEDEQGVLGYQITTPSPMGGHLARLAVLPRAQRQGIGYTLVMDMLAFQSRMGALQVTVNTQQDNFASLALYAKLGFKPSGEETPVYLYPPPGGANPALEAS